MTLEQTSPKASGNADGRFLLTIGEFRRTYFADKTRPKFATVRHWITNGTVDGVFLSGINVDGELFVDGSRVSEFFDALEDKTRTFTPTKTRKRSPQVRAERALNVLRMDFGL